ncbi:MAG: BamA/TamA family outer membrane protein, partial [Synechococcaceae cyanobacterium]|nr:BamA/TamA family outer membrane protein [Synechococcaceae cyanobacterium]
LSLSFEREWELNYRLNRIDVVAGLAIASSLRRSYDVNAAISYVDPREPRAKDGLIPTLNGSWTLNTLDDRFDPTSGSVTSLSGSFTPPGVGNFAEYWKGEGTRTGHVDLPLGVLGAYRFTAGLAQPFGVSEDTLIVNERFYAGGAGSHRGYPRRGLGPYDRESGNPEGGEVLLLSSAELRRRLKGSLHAALFVDAGQVWSKIHQPRAANIRFAIGSGLYLSTLVGAVRVDIAFPTSGVPKHLEAEYQVIRRRDGKRIRFLWHFTIGQPF